MIPIKVTLMKINHNENNPLTHETDVAMLGKQATRSMR